MRIEAQCPRSLGRHVRSIRRVRSGNNHTANQFHSRPQEKAVVVTPEITIQVKTTDQLIGEGWYDPEVEVTNSPDSPITITSVELFAQGVTYENKPRAKKTHPLTLLVRSTASLDIAFRFSEGVYRIFEEPRGIANPLLNPKTTAAAVPLDAR